MNDSLKAQCGAEFLGTGLFLFFGIGCLSALKVAGASLGLWEICIIWGLEFHWPFTLLPESPADILTLR
ncbi:propanediol utilization propanediol diffusion facilitator [Salmonella enterica subsp. enterica]|nr:propanediol utilization propanediol diffusion facilitator [Salmonella enterica subsp. enterica]SUH87840.1 propanediol utilization propanediol diffusion facilitator [Salmonella enterica subsp. enterica serovar Typhimurium]